MEEWEIEEAAIAEEEAPEPDTITIPARECEQCHKPDAVKAVTIPRAVFDVFMQTPNGERIRPTVCAECGVKTGFDSLGLTYCRTTGR